MADFDAFRDLTEAERKNWLNVQKGNRSEATRAEFKAGRDSGEALIRQYERAARDQAVENGHENDGGRRR